MHNIIKQFKKGTLTLEGIKSIEEAWNQLTNRAQEKKAIYFYKEIKKLLSLEKVKQIENRAINTRDKFVSSLSEFKKEVAFTQKLQLEKLIKIKVRKSNEINDELDNSIKSLIKELKNEKKFFRELIENSNCHQITKLLYQNVK